MSGEQIDLAVFWTLPEMTSFFPLKFSGRARWDTFTGQCTQCEEDILSTHLRGHVKRIDACTFEIRSIGYCASCNLITRFVYLLHDDMSITGKSPTSGEPARWSSGGERDLQ